MNALLELFITFFFGIFGVHKFMNKQIGMGILYFFTGGLFGIGWFVDSCKALFKVLAGGGSNKVKNITNNQMTQVKVANPKQTQYIPVKQQVLETSKPVESIKDAPTNKICEYCGGSNDYKNNQCYNCGATL